MKLATLEYLQEVLRRSNADPAYLKLAAGNNESYTLVIQPDPAQGVTNETIIGFDSKDGLMHEVWVGQRPTLFTLSGPYNVWVDILRGKMGATKAITMRKLKTQGPFLQLLQGGARIIRWVEILRTIPTEFEGNFSQYNFAGVEMPEANRQTAEPAQS